MENKRQRLSKIIIFAPLFIFLSATAVFAETTIKAEVDKSSITTDEHLTYKVIVSTEEKNIPQPQIPEFEGFTILSSAQTSNIKFAKGIQKTGQVFIFLLVPKDIGKFNIGPSMIKVKGKTYSTDSFEIEVKQVPASSKEDQPETEEPELTL